MNVKIINPFVEASMAVVQTVINVKPKLGKLSTRSEVFTSQSINVMIGLTGDAQGVILFSLGDEVAKHITSTMLGQEIKEFDQLALSAIAELGNMISGQSLMILSKSGAKCDITPPTVIQGKDIRASTLDVPSVVIPLTIEDIGLYEITVSIK